MTDDPENGMRQDSKSKIQIPKIPNEVITAIYLILISLNIILGYVVDASPRTVFNVGFGSFFIGFICLIFQSHPPRGTPKPTAYIVAGVTMWVLWMVVLFGAQFANSLR